MKNKGMEKVIGNKFFKISRNGKNIKLSFLNVISKVVFKRLSERIYTIRRQRS